MPVSIAIARAVSSWSLISRDAISTGPCRLARCSATWWAICDFPTDVPAATRYNRAGCRLQAEGDLVQGPQASRVPDYLVALGVRRTLATERFQPAVDRLARRRAAHPHAGVI